MPKIALDRFYIIPVFDGDNGVLMAKIVETQLRATHLFDNALEATIDGPIGQDPAFRVGKDKVCLLPFRRFGFHEQLLLLSGFILPDVYIGPVILFAFFSAIGIPSFWGISLCSPLSFVLVFFWLALYLFCDFIIARISFGPVILFTR